MSGHVLTVRPMPRRSRLPRLGPTVRQEAREKLMTDARHVHESAIVIDSVSPLSADGQYLDVYRDGGVTVVTPTVAMGGATASSAIRALGLWHRLFRTRPDLIQVRSGTDIRKAKETGSLGILLAFQGADAIEDDIDLIDAYKSLGVGVMQLT